jgi:C4-dicarboxylate-specific signal transduction histidine kinase
LQQVMTNLILNALQAMSGQPEPHVITIRTGQAESSNGAVADAVITVEDTGPGLSSELDGRLFTPFATTKATGTGLGLVVARSIAQDHGGTLHGTNRTDGVRGACFIMKLPMITAPITVPR